MRFWRIPIRPTDCRCRPRFDLAVLVINGHTVFITDNRAALKVDAEILIKMRAREEIAADGTSETEKLFFQLERAEAVMEAFEHLNYRERAMVSAHLGFCMECYSTQMPKQAFIDIAIDHGLASLDTADKTYRKALQKMKLELIKQEIY